MCSKQRTPRPPRSPRAFLIDEAENPAPPAPADYELEAEPDAFAGDDAPRAPAPVGSPKGFSWGRLLVVSLGLLATLGLGLSLTNLVAALFAAQSWLGWLGLGLAGLAGLAGLGLVVREIAGIMRLGRITALRNAAGTARGDTQVRAVITDLTALYAGRADCTIAIADMVSHTGEVIDAADRLAIAETTLLGPLDRDARRLVAGAVKRVSVVTAVSPLALLDVGFAALTHIGLIRGISRLYGGRPGFFGLMRLTRMVITHLAVTGSLALGDQLIGQVIGHGLAARLSARLGEGVLNGLLAARVGKAAIEMCRPMDFVACPAPRITELAAGLMPGGFGKTQPQPSSIDE